MKRTTVALDERLLERLRNKARAEDRLLQDCINEVLRLGLDASESATDPPPSLPVFQLGRPRVELADREALQALMDDDV